MELLRTPESRFSAVVGYDYDVSYAEVPAAAADGAQVLRMAYVDAGPRDAPPVLCLHGEPSWGFLYRHVAARLLETGHRVVIPDLVGFGRSDKPGEVSDHSYAAHVGWLDALLFGSLGLTDITLLCQDWGGLLGLRLVAAHADAFSAVVAANTGLPDGQHGMPPEWMRFRDFVANTPDLPVSLLVSRAVVNPMSVETAAAYDAPFPGAEYKAGPRAMPGLIPLTPEMPGATENQAAWGVLATYAKPFVCAFSDGDPITRGGDAPFLKLIPGARGQNHVTLSGGHFLQEDCGPALADVVAGVAG